MWYSVIVKEFKGKKHELMMKILIKNPPLRSETVYTKRVCTDIKCFSFSFPGKNERFREIASPDKR